MITSKQIINFINEDYEAVMKTPKGEVVIYKDPTPSDLKELKVKELRYIADVGSEKGLYVWDGNLMSHAPIFRKVFNLGSMWAGFANPRFLFGDAESNGKTLTMVDITNVRNSLGDGESISGVALGDTLAQLDNNWSFLDKYFTNASTFISASKQKLIKYGTLHKLSFKAEGPEKKACL